MRKLKPIQTEYNGYLFRSRLEARWAVFFDACGVDYEYEPEGYKLDNDLLYLPDFLLHGVDGRDGGDLFVEVKGKMTDRDALKINSFVNMGFPDTEYTRFADDQPLEEEITFRIDIYARENLLYGHGRIEAVGYELAAHHLIPNETEVCFLRQSLGFLTFFTRQAAHAGDVCQAWLLRSRVWRSRHARRARSKARPLLRPGLLSVHHGLSASFLSLIVVSVQHDRPRAFQFLGL